MKYINTGKPVDLRILISSGYISDRTIIRVFKSSGQFLTRGNWYQDQILDLLNKTGIATKSGTGLTVSFKLI